MHPRDALALLIFHGHTHSSNGALKTQDCIMPMGNSFANRLSLDSAQKGKKAEKNKTDFRDNKMQQLQHSTRNADAVGNPHRTNSVSPSSHSNTKISGSSPFHCSGAFKPQTYFCSYSQCHPNHQTATSFQISVLIQACVTSQHGSVNWPSSSVPYKDKVVLSSRKGKLKKIKTGRSSLVVPDTGR